MAKQATFGGLSRLFKLTDLVNPNNLSNNLQMDPRTNPYAPGAGVTPPEFAGRENILKIPDSFEETNRWARRYEQQMMSSLGIPKHLLGAPDPNKATIHKCLEPTCPQGLERQYRAPPTPPPLMVDQLMAKLAPVVYWKGEGHPEWKALHHEATLEHRELMARYNRELAHHNTELKCECSARSAVGRRMGWSHSPWCPAHRS